MKWTKIGVFMLVLMPLSTAMAQTGRITGTVTDAETNETLPGVNIILAGTAQGAATDFDGNYEITDVSPGTYTVRASFVGFETQEQSGVTVSAGETVNVDFTLSPGIALQEVVVVGYGEQRRRDLTGSVASVSGESIAEISTPSVAQAMQGKVAGVQVTPSSAEPGSGAVIRVRGVGTLNDASPLYVVDGMLLDDINFLNPNDIQSMEVLKDASATAIYGSRGANGVIIVTTKKGNAGERPRFSFNVYAGTQSVQNPIDLASPQEYAMLANELAQNEGFALPFPDPNSVATGTDWQDEIFEPAPIQSYQVSAAGGAERINYYVSGNFISQAGVIPKSDFRRFTLRLNNDYILSEAVQFGHNINFSYVDGQQSPNVYRSLYAADPTVLPRNAEGDFSNASVRANSGNPAAAVFYTRNEENGGRLAGNAFADIDFLEDFTFRSSFGVDIDRSGLRRFVPVYFVSPTQQNQISNLRVERRGTTSWLWENTVNYDYVAERHRLSVLAGITAQSFYSETLGGERVNLLGESENLWYLNAGDSEGQINFDNAFDWKMLSYLFRTNYSLLDRYLFTASLRIDGSSRFGPENRYGYFPSAAVGWNVAEESFLRNNDLFSALKFRASWGVIGNDKIGAYPATARVTIPGERDSGKLNAVFGDQQIIYFGASPLGLANPEVRWEETRQTNVGVDMAFRRDLLRATFDYYRRLTDGILVQVPIPAYVGATSQPFVNAAEVLNTGVEGTLTWSSRIGSLDFELGVNASTLHNEVKSLGGGREEILGGGLGNEISFTQRTVPGKPIGYFWGYETAGVYQTAAEAQTGPPVGGRRPVAGDLIYVDQNGDNVIDSRDRTDLGSALPDYLFGFNIDLGWKSLDFSASFTGQTGNEIYNGKRSVRFGIENFERTFLDRWHGEGTSNTEPRVTTAGYNYQASDRFIENGSYLKLQTVTLGYRLPQHVTNRFSVNNARIYVNATNLFTITPYTGYTPEIMTNEVIRGGGGPGIDLGIYPTYRTITAGVSLSF